MKNNKLIGWVLVLAILLVGGYYLTKGEERKGLSQEEIRAMNGKEITVTGDLTCLEYKDDDMDQSCVRSIKGDDGVIYSLNGVNIKGADRKIRTGTEVKATGIFELADTSNSESSVFIYDGVLVLTSITEVEEVQGEE